MICHRKDYNFQTLCSSIEQKSSYATLPILADTWSKELPHGIWPLAMHQRFSKIHPHSSVSRW